MVMFKVQGIRNSPRPRGLARNQLDVVPTHMERSTFNYVCSDGQKKAAVIARPPLPRLAALRTRDHSEDHGARRLPQGTKTHKPVQRDTNATPTDETTSGTGGRETVKRQIGCRGALSAITVDIDTVSQSHILRQGKRARARLGNRGAVPRTGGRIKPGLGPDTGGTH